MPSMVRPVTGRSCSMAQCVSSRSAISFSTWSSAFVSRWHSAPTRPATSTLTTGGQAANVAAWVRCARRQRPRGSASAPTTTRAGSPRRASPRSASNCAGRSSEQGNGVIVSLVSPDGERSMCPDRGVAVELRAGRARGGLARLRSPARLGLRARGEPVREAALAAVGSRPRTGRPRQRRSLVVERDPRRRPGALPQPRSRSSRRTSCSRTRTRTRSSAGRSPERTGSSSTEPTAARSGEHRARSRANVVDTTGAGDALAAGWIVGGPDLALEAAARCVQQVGPMPDDRWSMAGPTHESHARHRDVTPRDTFGGSVTQGRRNAPPGAVGQWGRMRRRADGVA